MTNLRSFIAACLALSVCLPVTETLGQHSLITQGNNKLAIVDKSGEIEWEMKWGGIHDIHVLDSGNILTRQGVWQFDQFDTFGNSVSNSQLLDVKNTLR